MVKIEYYQMKKVDQAGSDLEAKIKGIMRLIDAGVHQRFSEIDGYDMHYPDKVQVVLLSTRKAKAEVYYKGTLLYVFFLEKVESYTGWTCTTDLHNITEAAIAKENDLRGGYTNMKAVEG